MTQVWFDDVDIGACIGTIDKGVMTTAHIMRWSAAVENFHRIHYDWRFATGHDKLPDVLVNGSWKQHVLVQLVKDSLGPGGWLWKLKFRYKKMDVVYRREDIIIGRLRPSNSVTVRLTLATLGGTFNGR